MRERTQHGEIHECFAAKTDAWRLDRRVVRNRQHATAQAQGDQGIEQVVVSASRVTIAGYTAPTPVTVVSADQMIRDAKIDLGDSLREMPSVGASDAPDNGSHAGNAGQGDAAISTINLRNLGVIRTLVLFDGQRVVASNPLGGGVDLSTIPATWSRALTW